ncbi:hypothetical protein K8T06_00930 [bacterium]|nr:hypothetical protein [bacterium]
MANGPLERLEKGNAPFGLRMAIAEGLFPLEGNELVQALAYLVDDKNPKIGVALTENIPAMPRGFLLSASRQRDVSEDLLHLFAELMVEDEEILQTIVLNRSALDKTLIFSAEFGPPAVLEILAQNRNRMLECPEILKKLLENNDLSRVAHYALEEFKERFEVDFDRVDSSDEDSDSLEKEDSQTGVATIDDDAVLEGMETTTSDLGAKIDPVDVGLKDSDFAQKIDDQEAFGVKQAEDLRSVKGFDAGWDLGTLVKEVAGEDAKGYLETDGFDELLDISVLEDGEEDGGSNWLGDDLDGISDDLNLSPEDLDDDDEEEKIITDTRIRLMKMSAAKKLILAQMGTKQERMILVTDPNKKVAVTVVEGPKMSEYEIQLIAANRQVYEEVLRTIAKHRVWSKSNNIRRALVLNPKTPLALSTRMLSYLNEYILKDIVKSKELPTALVNQAKRVLDIREKRRGS